MNTVDYHGDGTGSGPSRGLFADLGINEPDDYSEKFDDFLNPVDQVSTEDHGGYRTYMDTGVTCVQQKTEQNGVIMFDSVDGDNDEAAMTLNDSNILAALVATSGSNKKFWFETRVKFNAITAQASYIGLMDANSPAGSLLPDAGTGVSGKNHIGFEVLEASPASIGAVYDTAAGTTTCLAGVQTIVADTWYKLGIKYDGSYVRYFVDSVEVCKVAISATNVPDGVYLAPIWALKAHEAVDKNLSIDWWKAGIER